MPLVIDEQNNVILGNARLLAMIELGLTSVPVIRITHLDETMMRALIIADNQFCLNAEWYKKELRAELAELQPLLAELGLQLMDLGFEAAEIDIHLGDIGLPGQADDVPLPAIDLPAVTKPGDIWILGDHRLICGDAREDKVYQALMGGISADMVFADMPYNVPTSGHICGNGKIQHREFAMAAGEMDATGFIDFMVAIFSLLRRYSRDGSVHMQCMDWRHIHEILTAALQAGYGHLNTVCWVKHAGGMGSLYRSQHEFVHIFKSGDAPHINNVMLGKYGRNRTNVWHYEGANSLSRARRGDLALHPTVKPVDMVADAIKDCSNRGGIILDPCGGSGTTLIAADQTGRIACLIEIDPIYCDVIVRRWQQQTGGTAILEASGQPFVEQSGSEV